jgi:hypothetical protein
MMRTLVALSALLGLAGAGCGKEGKPEVAADAAAAPAEPPTPVEKRTAAEVEAELERASKQHFDRVDEATDDQ